MNKCKTCKWWVDRNPIGLGQQKGMKHCEGINWNDDACREKDTQLFLSVDEGVYHIETDADFGCIEWEQK